MNGRRCNSRGTARAAAGAAASGLLFLAASRAEAHLVTTGLGPVYDGISHLLVSVQDLLAVLTFALLAGQSGPAAGRWTLFILPTAWFVAGYAGYAAGTELVPAAAATVSFLALGVLVALGRRLPAPMIAVLAALLGSLHGWMNGAGIAVARREPLALVGICSMVFVLVALAAALAASLRKHWTRIAVRVAGSWVAAIGLLLLGWSLRGSP